MSEQDMHLEDEATAAGGSVEPPGESSSDSPAPEAAASEALDTGGNAMPDTTPAGEPVESAVTEDAAAEETVDAIAPEAAAEAAPEAESREAAAAEAPLEAESIEPAAVEVPAAQEDATAAAAETVEAEAAETESTAEPVAEEAATAPVSRAPIDVPGMNWYIIHTYSGFEHKVAESLKARAQAFGFTDRVGQVLVPTEEVIELRNSKKVTSKRLLYPGYVMVQLALQDVDWEDLWHLVVETPRVTGFVGGGKHPIPMSKEEVDAVFNRQAASAERPRPKLTFEKNETVRIIDGPFTNFQGKVDDVNLERNTLRVLVTIFGRATPVELEFLQVEKLN
jgi:transcriptional antiterminator NusG